MDRGVDMSSGLDMGKDCMTGIVGMLNKEGTVDKGWEGTIVVQLITLSEMYWVKNWKSGCDQKFDLRVHI